MTASPALLSLLAHAERERNGAMSEAKRIEMEHRNAQRQAEQLLAYRNDYEQRWSRSFGNGGGIAIVHCYQGFMDRLGGAIAAQQRVVAMAAQRLANAQGQWQQHEIRVAAIRKLIERRSGEARVAEARLEQRQQDEHGLRAAWQRAALSPL
ncbi:MAG: flagellar export protein FliJ [Ideonella sp.]|nr:flagellar export protein FliJ [Ideonella sp.]